MCLEQRSLEGVGKLSQEITCFEAQKNINFQNLGEGHQVKIPVPPSLCMIPCTVAASSLVFFYFLCRRGQWNRLRSDGCSKAVTLLPDKQTYV